MKELKNIIISILLLSGSVALAQPNLKYSGLFDSYYTTGPVKYFVEPGLTLMNGELGKNMYSFGVGAGVNYRILPPVYLNGSVRYMNMRAIDHDALRTLSFSGNYFQFNAIGNYHFVYDLVRKSYHRRRGQKKLNAYVSAGLSFMIKSNIVGKNDGGGNTFGTLVSTEKANITQLLSKFSQVVQFPIGIGAPIRITPRFTLTPEIMGYFSFSDKLDGLDYTKTNRNDAYVFLNLKFMFNPKGKRLHPKQLKATSSGDFEGSGGTGGESEFDDDGFDSFDTSEEETITEEETIEQESEEVIEEDSIDEEEIIEEDNEEDSFEDEGEEKYDEDGFLIDDN